jgi:hypothetical protein
MIKEAAQAASCVLNQSGRNPTTEENGMPPTLNLGVKN